VYKVPFNFFLIVVTSHIIETDHQSLSSWVAEIRNPVLFRGANPQLDTRHSQAEIEAS
jgi:hypothetical protein